MSFQLIVKPEAEADLQEAATWYNRQREGLGDEFLDAAKDAMQHIRRNPTGYALLHGSIRALMLRRFRISSILNWRKIESRSSASFTDDAIRKFGGHESMRRIEERGWDDEGRPTKEKVTVLGLRSL